VETSRPIFLSPLARRTRIFESTRLEIWRELGRGRCGGRGHRDSNGRSKNALQEGQTRPAKAGEHTISDSELFCMRSQGGIDSNRRVPPTRVSGTAVYSQQALRINALSHYSIINHPNPLQNNAIIHADAFASCSVPSYDPLRDRNRSRGGTSHDRHPPPDDSLIANTQVQRSCQLNWQIILPYDFERKQRICCCCKPLRCSAEIAVPTA